MRFMMIIKSNADSESDVMPTEEMMSAMGKYNDELTKAGAMLAADGLRSSKHGKRVRVEGGKAKVIDGPFAEAKELVAGFWIIQAKSKKEALDWATRVPFGNDDGEIEIRQLYEMEDVPVDPSEKPDGWRAEEQKLRDEQAATPPPRKPGTRRYLLAIKGDKTTESGKFDFPELFEEMGALISEQAAKGNLLAGEGLKPSADGAKVTFTKGKPSIVDGPFTEAKELIAGYTILQTASVDEAVEVARRQAEIHAKGTGAKAAEVEVREIGEIEDLPVDPAEKPDGWRAKELAFRDRTGQ